MTYKVKVTTYVIIDASSEAQAIEMAIDGHGQLEHIEPGDEGIYGEVVEVLD